MPMTPTATVLTNELKLHDYKNTKLSVTFGDADINDGYSYARIKILANDLKMDLWQDKPTFNIIGDYLTFNDYKVWNETNDGPNSGLNADLLDGMHATEFKDRYGRHHFAHMFYTSGGKNFVKIASFATRRVGTPPDFNVNGTVPYQGIFVRDQRNILTSLAVEDSMKAFKANTPPVLNHDMLFHSTDMYTEGVYNGCLRATITMLKQGRPTTMDVHVGLFEDPRNDLVDGWNDIHKMFYVSCHDNNLPFIEENHTATITRAIQERTNSVYELANELAGFNDDSGVPTMERASVSPSNPSHSHDNNRSNHVVPAGYVRPADPTKDYQKPPAFPPRSHEGSSYGQYVDVMRLYHVDTTRNTVDGVEVITHNYDLYLCVDSKAEVRIQPYMSSACFIYNFEKPIDEGQIVSTGKYLQPKSIYDDRYSHKNHRHYDYEEKIWDLIGEVDEIWDAFDYYVPISQGTSNKNKVLMTDNTGNIYCEEDNLERHKDTSRAGSRVLVTDAQKCISESEIKIRELSQLAGVNANIQQQIDELDQAIKNLKKVLDGVDTSGFVKKSGDTMTGSLTMKDCNIVMNRTGTGGIPITMRSTTAHGWSITREDKGAANGYQQIFGYNNADKIMKFWDDSFMVDGHKVTISSSAPSSPKNGDVWIKI